MGDSYEQHFDLRERAFDAGGDGYPGELTREEVEPYLVDRLRAVGWDGNPMLHLGLAPLLHEATGGERKAIDRAMTALLEEAAQGGRTIIEGDGLAAWLDQQTPAHPAATASADGGGLAEAQIGAIEVAFADHDRQFARLRRELADLRDTVGDAAARAAIDVRLETIEARLDQQEAALRHVLEQLIDFFAREQGAPPG